MAPTPPVQMRIHPDLLERIDAAAAADGVSRTQWMCDAARTRLADAGQPVEDDDAEGWACRGCGFHPDSEPSWCAAGCGRDYTEMLPVDPESARRALGVRWERVTW